jgi:hypothetical protein
MIVYFSGNVWNEGDVSARFIDRMPLEMPQHGRWDIAVCELLNVTHISDRAGVCRKYEQYHGCQ